MVSERAKRVGYLFLDGAGLSLYDGHLPPFFLLPVQQPGLIAASSLLLNI